MAKMTLEELRKFREEKRGEMLKRDIHGKDIEIIIGMGTCGIAAGSKKIFDVLVKAVDDNKLTSDVIVRQSGCMGSCPVEPTVKVIMPNMPDTTYAKVDESTARDIVLKHIIGKTLIENHLYDRLKAEKISK